jgi:hypothetical protein
MPPNCRRPRYDKPQQADAPTLRERITARLASLGADLRETVADQVRRGRAAYAGAIKKR